MLIAKHTAGEQQTGNTPHQHTFFWKSQTTTQGAKIFDAMSTR
jgi:hypothetical protein